MHIIRNVSADTTSEWIKMPPGDYTLICNSTASLGGGTLKLQLGAMNSAGNAVLAAADDADLTTGPSVAAVIVTITPEMWVRGVFSGSTSASAVNLWLQ